MKIIYFLIRYKALIMLGDIFIVLFALSEKSYSSYVLLIVINFILCLYPASLEFRYDEVGIVKEYMIY